MVQTLTVWDMIKIIKTGDCCGKGHAVDAVPHLISAQAIDRFLLSNTIAAAQSCHAVDFRERARDNQVRMIFHESDHTLVVGAIGIMKIRFVYENHRLWRSRCDEIPEFVLWRDAGGRVVW